MLISVLKLRYVSSLVSYTRWSALWKQIASHHLEQWIPTNELCFFFMCQDIDLDLQPLTLKLIHVQSLHQLAKCVLWRSPKSDANPVFDLDHAQKLICSSEECQCHHLLLE